MYASILSRDFEILSLEEKNKRISSALKTTISTQLIQWELTESEIQIAFLLVKGFSGKEIASIRLTSEKTIRDQSSHIYRKAGVKSRAEFAAFFLEDLL
jgi:DNA-binding NarL/FixJ family response regulator